MDAVSNAMSWMENLDGNFTLAPEEMIYEMPEDHDVSRTIHPLDWDNDGDTDILINVGVALLKSQIYILNNDGQQNYTAELVKDTISSLGHFTFSRIADVDDDGDMDLIIHGGPSDIGWFENHDGTFSDMHFIHEYFDFPGDFDLIDIDRDGDLDVFWCGHHGKYWKENLGGFTFGEESIKIGPSGVEAMNDMAFGDIDGDNDIDLVTFGRGISSFPQAIRWYENLIEIVSSENTVNDREILFFPNPAEDIVQFASSVVE